MEYPREAEPCATATLELVRPVPTELLHVPDIAAVPGQPNLSDVETAVKVLAAWWNMQLAPVLTALT